ncbi:MAG TPA: MFS transporter [Nocardioides sp.]|uniref:MFS transporter n=1 Tax=Nocardioides sp. TaxID=35761 RepID=UPI002E35F6F3|nr:MFS transporter [Nocardioides sp.]HEX5090516.1 MFS transporter [Nocardioides sp.]
MTHRLLDVLAPPRLGRGFRLLLASSWTSNAGDGIALAAGPLLVASKTDHEFLVALAALLQWLPPLLFGLWAGAITDRLDRRLIIVVVDSLRVGVLVLLAAAIALDTASIGLVLVAMFLLGTAEVFADNTTSTLLPMLVTKDDLTVGNSRLMAGFVTINQLVAPPIGAFLFTVGQFVPFVTQAALVVLAVLLIARLRLPPHKRSPEEERPVWHDIIEGIRWTMHHAAVRTLVLTILIFNVTFGAAWSVLVLYATRHLGLGSVGFGLITTVQALGGLLGTLAYGWLTRRISLGDLMRIGLVIETLTHLILASTSSPWVALPVFFVFGAHAFIWGTTSITVRQRAVPSELMGRVGAVNLMGVYGGLVVGAGIGGVIAQRWGVTAPFWFAFVGSALFVVLIWRQLSLIAHDDDLSPAVSSSGGG